MEANLAGTKAPDEELIIVLHIEEGENSLEINELSLIKWEIQISIIRHRVERSRSRVTSSKLKRQQA